MNNYFRLAPFQRHIQVDALGAARVRPSVRRLGGTGEKIHAHQRCLFDVS